jgi:hypothetical protein
VFDCHPFDSKAVHTLAQAIDTVPEPKAPAKVEAIDTKKAGQDKSKMGQDKSKIGQDKSKAALHRLLQQKARKAAGTPSSSGLGDFLKKL